MYAARKYTMSCMTYKVRSQACGKTSSSNELLTCFTFNWPLVSTARIKYACTFYTIKDIVKPCNKYKSHSYPYTSLEVFYNCFSAK
jgi:hypothetical protein